MSTIRQTIENELGGVTIPEQYEGVLDRAIVALEQREQQIRDALYRKGDILIGGEELDDAFNEVGLGVTETTPTATQGTQV